MREVRLDGHGLAILPGRFEAGISNRRTIFLHMPVELVHRSEHTELFLNFTIFPHLIACPIEVILSVIAGFIPGDFIRVCVAGLDLTATPSMSSSEAKLAVEASTPGTS